MSEEQASSLERAKAGDGRAFEELLAPVLDPAFRLAMTMLKDRTAAEDVVQDAAFKEVARVFGCSEGAARQRIHRALAALRPGLVLEVNG